MNDTAKTVFLQMRKPIHKVFGTLVTTLCLIYGQVALAAVEVPLYSYYTDPPFNAKLPNNLTDRLATWLTDHSNGKYHFKAQHLPRKRLQHVLLEPDWQGIVAWANPKWFADAEQQRFLWSKPLGEDINLVASHQQNPIDYREPSSLIGYTLGGILGHHYVEFEALIAEGKVRREDIYDTEQNLLKLKARRVDVIFLPASSVPEYRRIIPDLSDWLYLSPTPRDTFKRYLFSSHSNKELMHYINQQIDAISQDTQWQSIFQEFASQLPKSPSL